MAGQNKSSAVMQQKFDRIDVFEDYPTPPWATRALLQFVLRRPALSLLDAATLIAAEPCANRGYMVKPLREWFGTVIASDIFDYGAGFPVQDYLFPGALPAAEWTFFNPPFRLAEQFLFRSFETPDWRGTAMLVRTSFLEGIERFETIFRDRPPTIYAQFAERVIMHKGILRDPDIAYFDPERGKMVKPSTATSYCWLVWVKDMDPQPPIWIPPCRKLLTKEGDYPT